MTDRYAVRLFEQLFIPKPWAIERVSRDARWNRPPATAAYVRWYIGRFMFALDLTKIRTAARASSSRSMRRGSSRAEPGRFRRRGPGVAGLRHHQGQGRFRLAGRVRTTLELPCSRCLEPLHAGRGCALRPALSAAEHATGGEGEREVEEDDLTTAFYENDEIDLGQLMQEQFYLALPMKPLCRDECQGCVRICGTNLNRGACACASTGKIRGLRVL